MGVGFHLGRKGTLAASYYQGPFLTQILFGMWFQNTYRFSVDQLYSVYTFQWGDYYSFPINVGLGAFGYFNEKKSGDGTTAGNTRYHHVGLRAPVNVTCNHQDLAFDVYAEIVPALRFTPQVTFDLYGGLGIRVYPLSYRR